MSDLRKTTPVEVSRHAIVQYAQRLRDPRPHADIEAEIIAEVRDAIGNGRQANHKRVPFKLFKERRKGGILPHQKFVWAEDNHAAWIIAREPGRVVVVTTLSPAGSVRTYA